MADRAEDDIRAAIGGLAYHFVMFEEVVRRVGVLERRHRAAPTTSADETIFELSSTTSGYMRPAIRSTRPGKILNDLTEYRTYVELSLLLARKVNDVVSPKPDRREDDVILSDFTASSLPSLDTVKRGVAPPDKQARRPPDLLLRFEGLADNCNRSMGSGPTSRSRRRPRSQQPRPRFGLRVLAPRI